MTNRGTELSLSSEASARLAHLNLVQFARESTLWARGNLDEHGGFLTFSVDSPAASLNGVHRVADDVDEELMIATASHYFAKRAWTVWLRRNDADYQIKQVACRAGLVSTGTAPAMGITKNVTNPHFPSSVDISRAISPADFDDFWQVSEVAFANTSYSGDLRNLYSNSTAIRDTHIFAVVARHKHKPVGAALSLSSGAVAGVYWVGVIPDCRRAGVGAACTAIVTEAAQRAGAAMVVLQSSPAGFRVYERLGFKTMFEYETLTRPEAAA